MTEEKNSKNLKKKHITEFLSIVELIAYSVVTFVISAVVALSFPDIIKNLIDNDSNAFSQIFSAIVISSQSTGILMAVLFVFIIWGIFKFNRIERRIIETRELLEKYIINSQNSNENIEKYEENDDFAKADITLYIIGVIAFIAFGIFVLFYKFI